MSQQINLFNPLLLKQRKYFSAITMMQALGLILLGCLGIAIYTNYQVSSLTKAAAATTARLGESQAQLAQVNAAYAARQKNKSLEADIQKAEMDAKSLQQIMDILHKGEFGNKTGYAEYMRAFSRQILDGVWLTGFNIYGAGSEIGIQGRALQPELVPTYLTHLKREPVMQGKSFAVLEMQRPSIDQTKKQDATGDKPRVQAGYIEFSLRSSDVMKDDIGMPGDKNK